jgi:hypothetical protein
VGNTAPIECQPGTFNFLSGMSNCTLCPIGSVCPGYGQIHPEICPAGFVCNVLGLSFPVVLCPQGYYCAVGTSTDDPSAATKNRPIPCQPGTFCLGGVASESVIEWIPSQSAGADHPQGIYLAVILLCYHISVVYLSS